MIHTSDIVYQIPNVDQDQYILEGKGQKKLLIILDKQVLEGDELQMLQKMMQAIHHDYDNDLYRIHLNPIRSFDISFPNIDFKYLISFGIKPLDLGYSIPFALYKPVNFDAMWALFVDDVNTLKNLPSKKQELWSCLKAKFLS